MDIDKHPSAVPTESEFIDLVCRNPVNARLLERLPALEIPNAILTAGCLVQVAWNLRSGRDAAFGIKDYDVFYFDDSDLSWEAEDSVIRRAAELLGDVGGTVEIRNQARVHLWYREKFGAGYPQLSKAEDGIDRYLTCCTRIGIRVADGSLYAPDGLADLWNGILKINPLNSQPILFRRKCDEYLFRWPWLTVID